MSHDFALMPNETATEIMTMVMEHLADWPMKSAETFRNAALGADMTVFAINPLLNVKLESDIAFVRGYVMQTVSEGRMIDFGLIPNELLKTESVRSRAAFETGELQHPFDAWVGIMSWEGGFCAYHICPHPRYPGETLVFELYGISIPNMGDVILLYDIVSISVSEEADGRHGYHTVLNPAHMILPEMNSQDELEKRGANSLDPLVVMLRFLADASIPVIHKPAPDRLNKHRAKQGKHLIPAHNVVLTKDYVAAFHASGEKHGGKGGTHASPIAHWRRAHKRQLSSGRVVPVRSSKVNWRDSEELHRMFYRAPDKK